MSNITELKVILSEYIKPDDGQPVNPDDREIRPVDPDIPNTDKDTHTGDHGFFTVSDVSNSESSSMFDGSMTLPLIALSFLFALLFAFLLPKVIRTLRNKNTERYDLKRSKFSTLRFLSTLFISSSLFFGLFSTAFGYKIPTVIDTTVSEKLTINANIIGTSQLAFVKDTITIPASSYGYNLYISSDESDETELIGDSTDKVISSIKTDGALADGTYGFTFDNPEKADAVFHPLQKKSERTAVRSFTKEETIKEQNIPIYYAVKASNLDESVYRTNIEYTTIDDHDLTLEEVTPEVCAILEEGVIDYTFKSSIDGKDYSVYKLKDGNCWTKEIPSEAIDPDDPAAPDPSTIPNICPTNWHEAKANDTTNFIDNYDVLDIFYDVNNPDTETDTRIVNLKENSCIADYTETTFSFDLNGGPEGIEMPAPETVTSTNFETIYTLPNIPDSPLSGHFRGWSLTPDAENPQFSPGDAYTYTFTSPKIIFYAIWDEKTPKAILDEDGLLNFVYDYYTVEEVIASRGVPGGYWENYETTHNTRIKTEGVNCEENHACVYLVLKNVESARQVPWIGTISGNADIVTANFENSFKEFKPESTYAWLSLSSLASITNLENLNTSETINMGSMFQGAQSLTSLALPAGFGSVAENMDSMFAHDNALASLELPENFGKNAIDMGSMFVSSTQKSDSLAVLVLPKGFGYRITNESESPDAKIILYHMFSERSSLEHIYVPRDTDWNTERIFYSAEMFQGTTNLPNYSERIKDAKAAHIGDKNGILGYFEDVCHYYGTCESEPTEPSPDSNNSINPAPISGNSTSPSYSPSNSVSPSPDSGNSVTPSDSSTTEPSTGTTTEPQDSNPEPYGVIRKAKATDKTDYALIIVTIISIALVFLGALIIFLIEKRDKDEDDDIEEY